MTLDISGYRPRRHKRFLQWILHRLCPRVKINLDGSITLDGKADPSHEFDPFGRIRLCHCLKKLVGSERRVVIHLLGPDFEVEEGIAKRPLRDCGGVCTTSGQGGMTTTEGKAGPGASVDIFFDYTNNHGWGYANGTEPWFRLAVELLTKACPLVSGRLPNRTELRQEHCMELENWLREQARMEPRQYAAPGPETPVEDGEVVLPYWWSTSSFSPPPIHGGAELRPSRKPCLFVPGVMGSVLVNDQEEVVWPPSAVPPRFADIDNLYPGLPVQANGELVDNWFVDPYSELITFMQDELKYELNENFWIFGYDWTKTNYLTGWNLAQFVRSKLKEFKKKYGVQHDSMDVVCHSMGGLVVRSALSLHNAQLGWKIFIASPHFGAPDAYNFLHPGMELAAFEGLIWSLVTRSIMEEVPESSRGGYTSKVQDFVSRCDSFWELLPDRELIEERTHRLVRVGGLAKKNLQETYSSLEPHAFPLELQPRVLAAMAFKNGLGPSVVPPWANIYWNRKGTRDWYAYNQGSSDGRAVWRNIGDGTVTEGGAFLNPVGQSFNYLLPGGHNDLPSAPDTLNILRGVLGSG